MSSGPDRRMRESGSQSRPSGLFPVTAVLTLLAWRDKYLTNDHDFLRNRQMTVGNHHYRARSRCRNGVLEQAQAASQPSRASLPSKHRRESTRAIYS
jgi:hypothetical protein